MSTIGQLSPHQTKVRCSSIEWTIGDIFSFKERYKCHYSPNFSVAGSKWYLKIYPNGRTNENSVGWISLYLHMEVDALPPQSVSFNFGVKKVDGEIEKMGEDLSWVFGKDDSSGQQANGCRKLLERSALLQRKSELAPEDVLTVTCDMQVDDVFDHTSKLFQLSVNLEDMFISKKFCDATLKVQQQEFPVHRCILTARCPVLARMFDVDKKEETGVVDTSNCDPKAFRDFLMYLYSGISRNLSNNAFDLYRIADKYGVDGLKSDCILFLENNLTVENVLDAAILGDQYNENELKSKAQDVFMADFDKIILSGRWDKFNKANQHLATRLLKNMAARMSSENLKIR